jgi:DNA polymerase-3 subunit delta
MIIKNYNLKNSLNYSYYLLYGSNFGQIEETINNILKPNLSKNIFYYDEDEIILNIDEFKEGILNKSFFDSDKLIIINFASDKILKIIEDLITKKISGITIIIKSNVLEKKSKLRIFFEKNKETICVPFFEDNYQSLLSIAQKFFSTNNIKTSGQIMNFIIEKSNNNRLKLNSELNKILNFYKKKSHISFKDIVKLVNSSERFDISDLTDQLLLKNEKKVIRILNDNIFSLDDVLLIARSLLYKLKRLKKIQTQLKIEKNQELIISSFKPAIFWKDKDVIKQQLKVLTLSQIKKFIKNTCNLELTIKQNSNTFKVLTNNFLIEQSKQINN